MFLIAPTHKKPREIFQSRIRAEKGKPCRPAFLTAIPVQTVVEVVLLPQVKARGVYLAPTHEENSIQQSARLSGSHELGSGQLSPTHVPVPRAIKSNIANRELFIYFSSFFRKTSVYAIICGKTRVRYRLII